MQVSRLNAIGRVGKLVERTPTYWYAFLFPALLFAHNPHAILHAEFWGEDGPVWYLQARDMGLSSLLQPNGGYLNSLQRLVAIAAQPFPLAWGPTLFALFALCMQSAPAVFLMSKRMSTAWPDRLSRLAFALLFIVMPNAPETSLNVTDSQWYLALLTFLIVVCNTPQSSAAKIFDSVILLVSGLSGPFGVLFFPVAALRALTSGKDGKASRIWRVVLLGLTSSVQVLLILGLSHEGRQTGPLGASVEVLVKIIALIPMGALLGYSALAPLLQNALFQGEWIYWVITLSCASIFFCSLFRGPRIFREFMFFAAVMFVLALIKPLISLTQPQWPMLLTPPAGNRYFLYPMIAWWGAIFVLAAVRNLLARTIALTLLACTTLYAVPMDWGDLFKLPETDFVARAHQFDASQKGASVTLPVHPAPLDMTVIKDREPLASDRLTISDHELAQADRTQGLCKVDSSSTAAINAVLNVRQNTVVSLSGWSVMSHKQETVKTIFILEGQSSHYAFAASSGIFRPDVVAALDNKNAFKSGYSLAIPFKSVAAGSYSARILTVGKEDEELCNVGMDVEVRSQ